MPRRSPPKSSNGVVRPRPVGSSSHARGTAHSGASTARPGRGEPVREDLVDDRREVPGGSPGARGEREVVGVGNLVRRPPECVHPRIAGLAAGEQEAIAGDRIRQRHLRAPPRLVGSLLVADGLGAARLAVALVAEEHTVGRCVVRDAQAHDGGPAELVGPLEDVELRAVVMRLGSARSRAQSPPWSSSLDGAGGQAADDPALQEQEERATGSAASSAPAVNGPQVLSYWFEIS